MRQVVKVQNRRLITIPKEIADEVGISIGDRVMVRLRESVSATELGTPKIIEITKEDNR